MDGGKKQMETLFSPGTCSGVGWNFVLVTKVTEFSLNFIQIKKEEP